MENILRRIVLFIALLFLIVSNSNSEDLNLQVQSLKKQIDEIQIQNQKMIEEMQRKSQKQIDDLRKKIEQLEVHREIDKKEVKELKAENKKDEGKIEEIINAKLEPLTGYLPKVKFNPDFPSYFRSRVRLIENGTFLGATPNTEDKISFADSRLLISPMLEVTENISLRSQIDVARNIIWGGIGDENSAEKIFEAPSPSDSFRGAVLREVTDTFSGNIISAVDEDVNFFDIRSLYFVAKTSYGEFWVGRQPYDWGLGILNNAGSMPDQDLGTIIDRFEFDTAPFALIDKKWEKLIFAITVDKLSQGRTLARGARGNGWEAGIGSIYFGELLELGAYLYLVNQEQFDITNGLAGDLDNALIWSLFASYKNNSYLLSAEYQNLIGKVNDLQEPLGSIIGSNEIDITAGNILLAVRAGYNPPSHLVDFIVAEFGWASGDKASTTNKLEGNAIFFNNAYTIDSLLYKHVIPNVYALEGSVINSLYLRLFSTFKLHDSVTFSPQVIFAWNDKTDALLDIDGLTPMPEVAKYMGTELEGTITYKILDHLWFDLIGSYIIPGDGLDDLISQRAVIEGSISSLDGARPASSIYSIQGRFIFTLDHLVEKWTGSSTMSRRWYLE